MACIPIPTVAPPTLGLGLSLLPPALPSINFGADLCCKLLQFSIVPPPIPLPPLVLNPAVLAALGPVFAAINAYLDALPLDCPLE
jgi:hypothetical protein